MAVAGFARGARRHGAIRGDAARIHDVSKLAERGGGVAQSFAIEFPGSKYRMAEPHRRAYRLHNFPVVVGTDARDHQAKRVGPGVDRRELDGFAES